MFDTTKWELPRWRNRATRVGAHRWNRRARAAESGRSGPAGQTHRGTRRLAAGPLRPPPAWQRGGVAGVSPPRWRWPGGIHRRGQSASRVRQSPRPRDAAHVGGAGGWGALGNGAPPSWSGSRPASTSLTGGDWTPNCARMSGLDGVGMRRWPPRPRRSPTGWIPTRWSTALPGPPTSAPSPSGRRPTR